MTKLTEKTFLNELLKEIPEFKKIYELNKEYHDIGIHLILLIAYFFCPKV